MNTATYQWHCTYFSGRGFNEDLMLEEFATPTEARACLDDIWTTHFEYIYDESRLCKVYYDASLDFGICHQMIEISTGINTQDTSSEEIYIPSAKFWRLNTISNRSNHYGDATSLDNVLDDYSAAEDYLLSHGYQFDVANTTWRNAATSQWIALSVVLADHDPIVESAPATSSLTIAQVEELLDQIDCFTAIVKSAFDNGDLDKAQEYSVFASGLLKLIEG